MAGAIQDLLLVWNSSGGWLIHFFTLKLFFLSHDLKSDWGWTTAPLKSICCNRKTYLTAWSLFWTFKLWVQTHEIWLSHGSCWWTRQLRLKILFYLGFSLHLLELDFNLYNMLKSSDLLVLVFTISHDFDQLHKHPGILIIRNKTNDFFMILLVWEQQIWDVFDTVLWFIFSMIH